MNNLIPKRYSKFEDLPNQIKAEIKRFGPRDIDSFIHYKMKAMNNKSMIDILNENNEEKGLILVLDIIKRRHDPMGS